MLRGRCACNAVGFDVADEFFRAYNCHCSNCDGSNHEALCAECLSLLYWTSQGEFARVPYGALVDEPALKPMGHMFVGSKALWHEITDHLPQYDRYPW